MRFTSERRSFTWLLIGWWVIVCHLEERETSRPVISTPWITAWKQPHPGFKGVLCRIGTMSMELVFNEVVKKYLSNYDAFGISVLRNSANLSSLHRSALCFRMRVSTTLLSDFPSCGALERQLHRAAFVDLLAKKGFEEKNCRVSLDFHQCFFREPSRPECMEIRVKLVKKPQQGLASDSIGTLHLNCPIDAPISTRRPSKTWVRQYLAISNSE